MQSFIQTEKTPKTPERDKNRGIGTQKPVMEFGRSFKYLLIIY